MIYLTATWHQSSFYFLSLNFFFSQPHHYYYLLNFIAFFICEKSKNVFKRRDFNGAIWLQIVNFTAKLAKAFLLRAVFALCKFVIIRSEVTARLKENHMYMYIYLSNWLTTDKYLIDYKIIYADRFSRR